MPTQNAPQAKFFLAFTASFGGAGDHAICQVLPVGWGLEGNSIVCWGRDRYRWNRSRHGFKWSPPVPERGANNFDDASVVSALPNRTPFTEYQKERIRILHEHLLHSATLTFGYRDVLYIF